ncbi:M16 family metallopeptidase [Albidovulum sediminicola]|uniref:Insulinase family protein n=1 Tax=Albidovulum sediminicola TaxID=2984331 RepID=A0ABT2Z6B3_9RHOB|nr:pitrilysin family protein [Defluviimonas sp. WL0075]MCV2866689.1 insulinase family protein [Defluviimonas sp. WL0075]
MIRALFAGLAALLLAGPVLAEVKVQQVTSPGGFHAWLVEEHALPFTALEIRFRGGTSLDRPGKRGETRLMAALIEEGAGDLDAQAFAEAREALAAEFSFDAWDDALSVSARFLTENRDASVALLKSALTQTRFDQDALDRVRGQVISIIQQDAKSPNRIATQEFDRLAFGDHPYGSSRNGTVETVSDLTREDMFEAQDRIMARDRMVIAAVGDITASELGTLLDSLLGPLPEMGAIIPPPAEFQLQPGISVIDYASPQSVVLFGQQGIKREDPDFFAAFVLDQIVGGQGFASRLMEEVREKRGLTYGIGTYLAPMDLAETWQGSFASANEKVAEAIAVVRDEWAKVAVEGVSEAELAAAKTYLTGSYPLRFDGNGPIADILAGMQLDGLPVDYLVNRNAYVEAVTAQDVKRVAARLMDAGALRFVVVGQPQGLQATE